MTTLGIDLGTTNSLIAVFSDDGPRVLTDTAGSRSVPSVVAIDDGGKLLVGAAARARAVYRPDDAVSRFKPYMGEEHGYRLGEHALGPVSLSALVLRELKARAEEALGETIDEAVITVPAWFREPNRRATIEAARLAGLRVRHLLNEPTAAALAYGVAQGDSEQAIAVLDLGGGTFDVTILELYDGMVDVRASGGDVHLGGEDYTDVLLRHVLSGTTTDALQTGAVRALVERAKRQLSHEQTVTVDLSTLGGPTVSVDRETYDRLCAPLNQRLRRCVQEALVQSGLRGPSIDHVLLVGGAVRMPAVAAIAESLFGQPAKLADDVDTLVARGAAVQAALLDKHAALRDVMVTDVLTHSLGVSVVQTWDGEHYEGRFMAVLSRGTTLPASRQERLATLHPEQTTLVLQVFEGEHRLVEKNERIGTLEIQGLPNHPVQSGKTEAVDVRFSQDVSGLLQIDATVLSTQQTKRLVLERSSRPLQEGERAQADRRLAAIAMHPREAQANRQLLEVATSVMMVVPQAERDTVDRYILAFESAMDKQVPNDIVEANALLTAVVRDLVNRHGLHDLVDVP